MGFRSTAFLGNGPNMAMFSLLIIIFCLYFVGKSIVHLQIAPALLRVVGYNSFFHGRGLWLEPSNSVAAMLFIMCAR